MAQGRCVALITTVLLGACTDTPSPQEANETLAATAEMQAWLASAGAAPSVAAIAQNTTNVPPVAEMISGLEERLRRNPDDLKGWRLLARSYAFIGDLDQAKRAADQAILLGADRAEFTSTLAKAHAGEGR